MEERKTGLLDQYSTLQGLRKLFYSLSLRCDGAAGLQRRTDPRNGEFLAGKSIVSHCLVSKNGQQYDILLIIMHHK